MPATYPNQRIILVYREKPMHDFLGIKNENWQLASRLLGPYGLQLYLYFASNRDKYQFALSPAAVREALGMAKSTYQDHFKDLITCGYLVPRGTNFYEFYERPKLTATQPSEAYTSDGLDGENGTSDGQENPQDNQDSPQENIEIYNKQSSPNKNTIQGQERKDGKVDQEKERKRKEVYGWMDDMKEFVF